jgi:tetratricopeptide (TPR) repeat protein
VRHLKSTRRLAGVYLVVLLLAGCAATPQTRSLLDSPPDALPASAELADTPFHPQQRYQCGPAALATVLGAQNIEVTPAELVASVYIPALRGSLPEEMAATARRYGMLAYPLQPSLTDLFGEIAHGHPVLVFQNLGIDWLPRWHFAVAVGYDLAANEVILRSGTTQRWLTTLANFERTWSRGKYWALVVLPPGSLPASARPDSYLQAAYDLETSGQADAAATAYLAATRRWPGEPHGFLALGNSHYTAGAYPQAAAAFRTATRLAPAEPQGWNNLAYALLKTACPQQARAAAACAAGLAPGDANYRDTLTEISALARGADAPHCRPVDCRAIAP